MDAGRTQEFLSNTKIWSKLNKGVSPDYLLEPKQQNEFKME